MELGWTDDLRSWPCPTHSPSLLLKQNNIYSINEAKKHTLYFEQIYLAVQKQNPALTLVDCFRFSSCKNNIE